MYIPTNFGATDFHLEYLTITPCYNSNSNNRNIITIVIIVQVHHHLYIAPNNTAKGSSYPLAYVVVNIVRDLTMIDIIQQIFIYHRFVCIYLGRIHGWKRGHETDALAY